jgi:hypothetical protein
MNRDAGTGDGDGQAFGRRLAEELGRQRDEQAAGSRRSWRQREIAEQIRRRSPEREEADREAGE